MKTVVAKQSGTGKCGRRRRRRRCQEQIFHNEFMNRAESLVKFRRKKKRVYLRSLVGHIDQISETSYRFN